MRSRRYLRRMREKHIARKQRISKSYWHVKYRGQLDKGKIHCSCPMCSSKTRRDGPSVSELRRLLAMLDDVMECTGNARYAHNIRPNNPAVWK